MAISYNPGTKKWNVIYEKTDYKTDYRTDYPTNLKTDYPTNLTKTVLVAVPVTTSTWDPNKKQFVYTRTIQNQWQTVPDTETNNYNKQLNEQNANANKINAETNKTNTQLNTQNAQLNQTNTSKNQAYDKTVATASSTKGGDYITQREIIRNISGIDAQTKKTLEDYYKAFYQAEKLEKWDVSLGLKPPYGDFDPSYYKSVAPGAVQAWDAAIRNDDLDIIGRYDQNSFYLHHYTTQGKAAGLRGNKAEELQAAQRYLEKAPTDLDLQLVRTLQLGADTDTQTQRLLNVPYIAEEWEKAKAGDSYWKSKGKELFLDVNKPDEFAALFRLSDRPEDKNISFSLNLNAGYGITELEDAINQAVGEKAIVDVKRFGALAQDVLKQTIDEMKKAKAREQELAIFNNFDAFNEITGINRELSNSILGDTGIGGVLSFMGGNRAQESLEKSLRNITGINNSVTYNWQQWFDDTLKQRYQDDLELGLTREEAEERVRVQGEFARDFIDKYLLPRFNESRSMNEFVEYLDVRQSEQNPFQTQDILNAVKLVADIRAQQFIEQLRKTPDRYFDSEFYFNPTGNKARETEYADQARTVTEDWEAAKRGDAYWLSQAYRFGIDVNDRDAFARMHFQVKGQGRGYDGADDILNASKVSEYIYNQILPALNEEALAQGTVFGQFLRPEEFADEMLKGLDPNNKDTWEELLKRYELDSFAGDINQLKDYIIDALRTGSAQEIREQIKYLNEKREKPTQEILGVTYIQRDEDYKPVSKVAADTELYRIFQNAGFQGTEDEFYENFFPDLDRSAQAVLTKAGKNDPLKMAGLDLKDPFAALGTIEGFFDFDEGFKSSESKASSSYFKLDDDVFRTEKTQAGQGFLDEFTSMFKL